MCGQIILKKSDVLYLVIKWRYHFKVKGAAALFSSKKEKKFFPI